MTPEERMFDEVAVIIDEHILKMFGVIKKAGRKAGKSERDHIAVLARAMQKEPEHVTAKVRQIP